jgi:predicted ATPase/class 3 adenylate cyclase
MQASPGVVTFLFTDIEGSTRLWEQEPERMRPALARHDAIAKTAVERHHGAIVKMAGDGIHAAFNDPLDAIDATLELQQALADPETTGGIALRIRCGLHAGVDERRDNDFFGRAVNRAARITSVAHGGQVLLSEAVAVLIRERLPADVSLRDLGSVRLRDLASPERVYQVVHPQLRMDFPALRALEATPNNLPQQVTSFIGREKELAEVKNQLRRTRLLTLFGAGGLGKTRLSLQVAADVLDDYADGVWFVDLAAMTDERLVPQAVALALGVKEEAGRPVIEALVKHVRDRRLLVILDNCEHLVRACGALAKQLLQAGPHFKILASSREHLRVKGETSYPVQPLRVPDPQEKISLEALTRCEAACLLVDRARAVQPAFQVTDENAGAVADICSRLDGIPLALELAAARVRALPVEEIAARLTDRFRLLTRGDRTALPRQQTLRASIDWSYDLLTDQERALLRRLAVFAGGLTLEAAEAVGVDGDVGKADVLDLLTNLVEKSLVTLEAQGKRYRLLETVREYAQERLNESGERDQTCARHLAFYVALAETAMPELVGPKQGAWLAQLDLERENLIAAHAWCDHAKDGAELGLRLAHSAKQYWSKRGLLGLRHRLTVEALARAGAQEPSLARCRGLFSAGQVCCFMGRFGDATRYLEECLAIARELDDKGRIAAALQYLGIASLGEGDLAMARGHLEEGLALARAQGDKRELAAAINALAQLDRAEGSLQTAEPLYEKVLALAHELGDRELIAIALLNLAMVAVSRHSADRARRMLIEVIEIAEETGAKRLGQSLLEVCAGLASLSLEYEFAARFYGAAEAQTAQTQLQRDPADEAFLAPLIAKAQQALGAAKFATPKDAGCALSYEQAIGEARTWLKGAS